MFGRHFELNEHTIPVVEEIGGHMPGGFFIYKAEEPGNLIYANSVVFSIFGCDSIEEFKELTGFTFRGMVHPDDYNAVTGSINIQISEQKDRPDYVEYRINRKDGKTRWVDDYGRYTETEAYGGIYYVFISDITEKKSLREAEKKRLTEEVEAVAKLAEMMGSVASLLSNMPAMSFSKDALTGKYLACNQSFAEYACRENPDEVVGLTDHDIFDKATADHFVEDDGKALSMDEPYIFFEDVPDAGGNVIRNLQTTKMKFLDSAGRLCLLGMCVDVTEMTKIKSAEARQQEMEHRLALQEQLLEEERRRAEQDKLITALASDYWSVYYVELDTNEAVCYQEHPEIEEGVREGDHFPYLQGFTDYAANYITDEFRDDFMAFIQPDNVREGLKEQRVISFRYMVSRHGRETYEMIKFAGVRHPEDRDDHIVHAVGACITDVDAETRNDLMQARALGDALKAAEEANRAKTAFLSNMSHEIRTPMNAIIGLDSIALNNPDISDETRDQLEKIGSSAQHLLSIINDILDMSRIESGRMTLTNEEFSFAQTLEQVNTMIGGQCRDKGVEFVSRVIGHTNEYYIGDDMKLRQILVNILGNAVKFTPSGGNISFTVEEIAKFDGKSTLRFVLSDTGIGMSSDFLPKLFDTFTQEDSQSTNKYGSTGLGMPITKSLVELMNGTIEVESEKGVGTTFTVTVTLTDSDRVSGGDTEGEIHPHEMAVLVIDDDPVACEHARLVLGQVGIHCDIALTGAEGVEMVSMQHARMEPYNLILVDWKMPEMDGIETTRRIRSVIGHESAIIILTSHNWDDVADEARTAGVDTFVPKPLFASSVMDEFRDAFRKKKASALSKIVKLGGRRVLLAEDMVVNAEIMIMVLAMRDIEADLAENGQIAVDMFAAHEAGYYDAILMDMRMPVMDGLEATRTIRAMKRIDAQSIPIIALTANAFDEDVQRSMQAGLDAHLSKPVEPDALFRTLEELLVQRS